MNEHNEKSWRAVAAVGTAFACFMCVLLMLCGVILFAFVPPKEGAVLTGPQMLVVLLGLAVVFAFVSAWLFRGVDD